MHQIKQSKDRLKDYFAIDQVRAFLQWCQSDTSAQKQNIYIDLGPRVYFCNFQGKAVSPTTELQFIISTPNTLTANLALLGISDPDNSWYNIFSTPHICIWENKAVHKEEPDCLPLRFGLNAEEKSHMLLNVRNLLTYIINPNHPIPVLPLNHLPKRFLLNTDLDVALWVDGRLRGSIVLTNTPLLSGAKAAASMAAQDARFKPLTSDELPRTAIQITVIHNLRLPLFKKELDQNEIYPEKSYKLDCGGSTGWYVPAVFNCLQLNNLSELMTSLLIEKVGLYPTQINSTLLTVSEVDDFVELPTTIGKSQTLHGPLLKMETTDSSQAILAKMAKDTIAYLVHNQEVDGNIPAIINPLTGQTKTIDWLRLAHTTFALLSYSKRTESVAIEASGKKAYDYLNRHFVKHKFLDPYTRCLTSIYLHKSARLINDQVTMKALHKNIFENISSANYEPILFIEIADFYQNFDRTTAATFLDKVLVDFEQRREKNMQIDLAAYVGLIPTLRKFGHYEGEKNLADKANEITSWYLKQQLSSGAFPAHSLTKTVAYVRGTGKILEILSKEEQFLKPNLHQALTWLLTLQYTDANTFFVPIEYRPKIIGGFRHDAQNQNVWLDASSHIILIEYPQKGV